MMIRFVKSLCLGVAEDTSFFNRRWLGDDAQLLFELFDLARCWAWKPSILIAL